MTAAQQMAGSSLSAIYKCDSRDRLPMLAESIRSIREQAPEAEVIVLSTDAGIRSRVDSSSSIGKPVDHCQDAPQALAAARNEGVEISDREWVAFFDDDAIPSPRWWQAVRSVVDELDADAAGGPLVPRWRTYEPRWLPRSYHWLIGCGPYYDTQGLVPNTYGSNFVVRRGAFEDIDGFDTSIGMGSDGVGQAEETDLARRLRAAGYDAVAYTPGAGVEHCISASDIAAGALLRRAIEQGQAKARIGLGDRESTFVREELGRGGTLLQHIAEGVLTGAVGVGYLTGRLRR